MAFIIRAKDNQIVSNPKEFDDYMWVSSLQEISHLEKIAGIDNHLVAALKALEKNSWQNLDETQLSEDKYLNQ